MNIALDTLQVAVGAKNVVIVIDTLLESIPGMCRQLRAAAICGNFRKLMHTAHQFKSDCANVGATALRERLQLIESGAERGTLTSAVAIAAVEVVSTEANGLLQTLQRARRIRARLQPTLNLTLMTQGA